ncbi:hypothetical protein [Actinomadura rudentiformis]|nr:hypothetical protein [Actinomadura rudentiformis]
MISCGLFHLCLGTLTRTVLHTRPAAVVALAAGLPVERPTI